MTSLQRLYQEECRIDLLMEDKQIEEQYLPQEHDRLLVEAKARLAEEVNAVVLDFHIVVVLYEAGGSPWDRWRYRTFRKPPAFTGEGCIHHVRATGLRLARVEALNIHKHECVGRG
jgi:hypothetical protein